MKRMFIRLLICLLIFIGGVSYGINDEEKVINPNENANKIEVNETEPIIEVIDEDTKVIQQRDEQVEAEDTSLVYKTATFFDKVVSSFYEVGVGLIYQFVNLFFD